jgi:hypothetical protein
MKFWYLRICRKSVEKIQVSLKSDKNNGYFTWRLIYIFYHFSLIFVRMRNDSDKIVEKIKTHILYSVTLFRKSSRLWDMWKNMVERDRPQMTLQRVCIACRIHKPSLRIYNTLLFHCNIVDTKAPQCYVIRTLSVLFDMQDACSSTPDYWRMACYNSRWKAAKQWKEQLLYHIRIN